MNNGFFITIEGGDGSGKTTQLEFMKEYFREKGENAIFTREPGGTPIGEKIRGIILDQDNREMEPMTEMLLYAASRAQLVEQVIKPALARGRIVVCDRYTDSSIAYQGYGRGLGNSVSAVNTYAMAGCVPDLTFLLKLDPEKGSERAGEEYGQDRIENEDTEFHRAVYEGYLQIEKQEPDRIVGIDASQSIEEVRLQIQEYLDRMMRNRKVAETWAAEE